MVMFVGQSVKPWRILHAGTAQIEGKYRRLLQDEISRSCMSLQISGSFLEKVLRLSAENEPATSMC